MLLLAQQQILAAEEAREESSKPRFVAAAGGSMAARAQAARDRQKKRDSVRGLLVDAPSMSVASSSSTVSGKAGGDGSGSAAVPVMVPVGAGMLSGESLGVGGLDEELEEIRRRVSGCVYKGPTEGRGSSIRANGGLAPSDASRFLCASLSYPALMFFRPARSPPALTDLPPTYIIRHNPSIPARPTNADCTTAAEVSPYMAGVRLHPSPHAPFTPLLTFPLHKQVCVPLAAPEDLLEDLGISPVRGLLLYGPPGCGKTLLARRLSAALTPRPPAVVSGPEILERFVGSSEANIRALFDFPPDVPGGDAAEQAEALHVIVMDEFDSIGQRRGGGDDGGDRVRDSVVNQ